jgi:hypothetical protein
MVRVRVEAPETRDILRHCPELSAIVPRTTSAFAPWRRVVPEKFGSAE